VPSLRLWVRGYGLSLENGKLEIGKLENGKYDIGK